jgi:lysophospholipase L1-like esterase
MKMNRLLFSGTAACLLFSAALHAQPGVPTVTLTNSPVASPSTTPAVATSTAARINTAIVPVSRTGSSTNRQSLVLRRARENPGNYDLVFIGDSITQGWEGAGTNVWRNYYGKRKCLNLGVSGDQTQHVLWRFEQGQLEGLKPKVAVVMIGTNNSGNDRNSEEEILAGVKAVVAQIRQRLPGTKILLLGIFPRGQTFNTQRGKLLQVNQALAKLDDGGMIRFLDFGSKLIEPDGTLAKAIMPDALHLSGRGYEIWAEAIQPLLKKML